MGNWFNQQYPQYNPYQFKSSYPNNGIIWVQGEEGAKGYQMAPNSNAVLMDSEIDGRFYIKTTDNVGMATLRRFSFTEIMEEPKKSNDYVTREDLKKALEEFKNEQSVSRTEPRSKFSK